MGTHERLGIAERSEGNVPPNHIKPHVDCFNREGEGNDGYE